MPQKGLIMKRKLFLILEILLLVLLTGTFATCENLFAIPDEPGSGNTGIVNPPDPLAGKSTLTAQFFIPDYKKLSGNSRVFAPQTSKVRLSIKGADSNFVVFSTLTIDEKDIKPVTGQPASLPGGIWTGTFTSIKAGEYAAGSMKIELLDSANTTITSGANAAKIVINTSTTAQAEFYTIPEALADTGSLASGQMKFWKMNALSIGDPTYVDCFVLKLTVTGSSSWPDIVLFNSDGTFNRYYSVNSAADAEIRIELNEKLPYYVGVYADNGTVASYKLEFLTKDKVGNLIVIIY